MDVIESPIPIPEAGGEECGPSFPIPRGGPIYVPNMPASSSIRASHFQNSLLSQLLVSLSLSLASFRVCVCVCLSLTFLSFSFLFFIKKKNNSAVCFVYAESRGRVMS